MSDDPKRYTERELVTAKREGFCAGVEAHARRQIHDVAYARTLAEIRYPLPPVTRPRVVRDTSGPCGDVEWKYEHGALWFRYVPNAGWERVDEANSGMYINPERVTLLANLIANPNETVNE